MGCCHSSEASTSPHGDDVLPAFPNAAPLHPSVSAAHGPPVDGVHDSRSLRGRPRDGSSSQQLQPTTLNHPVRAPSPVPASPSHIPHHPAPWSRSLLEKERRDFFDTRVTGRREIWDGLRVVCDMLRHGDITGAQGILDALNITCPYGRVAHGRGRNREKGGAYDEYGARYDIPAWALADPDDIVEDEEKDGGEDEDEMDEAADAAQRRDEKGKGRAEDLGDLVPLRVRLSDRGTDLVVDVGTKQRFAVAVRALERHVGQGKRVRLAYLGRILQESNTLEQSGWAEGHVINALVSDDDAAKKSE